MKLGIITQARMGSSRLPGKVLRFVKGKSILLHHLDRLRKTDLPVIVATTSEPADSAIVDFCISEGIPYHRGSELDVLSRFTETAAMHELDVIVRVTSDCPLVDPTLILEGLDEYLWVNNPRAYLSNGVVRTYARGFDFEIFSKEILDEANLVCNTRSDREHVTPYFYAATSNGIMAIHKTQPEDHSFLRVTLDEEADYLLIRALLEEFNAEELSHREIEKILLTHPELQAINKNIIQKKI